jgi:hypothetical protein
MAVMRDVERALESLAATSELPGVLTASWDAFNVLVAGCQHGERVSGASDMFVPFAFAATAAAEGRAVLMTAPSLPTERATTTSSAGFAEAEQEDLARALAQLARALHDRLAAATGQAVAEADRAACVGGAIEAALVRGLLARGEE